MGLINLLLENNRLPKSLYHFTDIYALVNIIKENKLKAQIPQDVNIFPDEYPDSEQFERVSLTSLDNGDMEGVNVKIVFNINKLKSKYDILPYKDPSLKDDEQEYIIKKDIYPLNEVVDQIIILDKHTDQYDELTNDILNIEKFDITGN